MKTDHRLVLFVAVLVASATCELAAASSTSGSSEDEAAIRKAAADFVAAWNRHDAKAMAATWAEDGDLINPFGRVAKGRAEIEKLLADEHSKVMKETTYTTKEVTVRFLTRDIAVSDWTSEVRGMRDPAGQPMPLFSHHVFVVYVKKDGKWSGTAGRPYAFLPPPGPPPAPATK